MRILFVSLTCCVLTETCFAVVQLRVWGAPLKASTALAQHSTASNSTPQPSTELAQHRASQQFIEAQFNYSPIKPETQLERTKAGSKPSSSPALASLGAQQP